MAIKPTFMVNMSGQKVTVWGGKYFDEVVGHLNPREAFSRYGFEGGWTSISFLGPNGTFIDGMLKDVDDSVLTPCTNHPYSIEDIDEDGTKYYVFIMRSDKGLYDPQGNQIGTVKAGKKVACLNATAGQNNQWLKLVKKYQNSSGEWKTANSGAKEEADRYGFVDTGLRTGSGYSKIAMYGSW